MMRKLGFGSVLSVSFLWAASALADPSAEDRATARSLAAEGYQALQTKDYSTAVDRFSRADALVHAPTLMIDWARSLVGLGKLVEAEERYEQIIREGVDAKAPKSWQRALTDATSEVAEIKPRLAWVTITVSAANDTRVTIDDVPVPPAAVGVRRVVNPGQRIVRVSANGFLKQQKSIELPEGAEGSVDFQLEADPDAAKNPAPQAEQAAHPENANQARDRSPSYVAFGAGGVGLVVGGVTGILALSKRSTLSKACDPSGVCTKNEQGTLNAYHSFGTVSAVGFGLGVIGIGTGLALWLLNNDSRPAPAAGIVVRPYVGVASLGAVGVF